MSLYLDASVVVPMLVQETTTPRLERWLMTGPDLCLSSWTIAEVSSALAFRRRTDRLSAAECEAAEALMDQLLAEGLRQIEIDDQDIRSARAVVRFLGSVKTPDALHLALAERHQHRLATYDMVLARGAQAMGLAVLAP